MRAQRWTNPATTRPDDPCARGYLYADRCDRPRLRRGLERALRRRRRRLHRGQDLDFSAPSSCSTPCAAPPRPSFRSALTALIREALLTLRSLIDWYLERLDNKPARAARGGHPDRLSAGSVVEPVALRRLPVARLRVLRRVGLAGAGGPVGAWGSSPKGSPSGSDRLERVLALLVGVGPLGGIGLSDRVVERVVRILPGLAPLLFESALAPRRGCFSRPPITQIYPAPAMRKPAHAGRAIAFRPVKTWVLTGSLENFRATRDRGFGSSAPRRAGVDGHQIEPGDEIVFYVTVVQAFGAGFG